MPSIFNRLNNRNSPDQNLDASDLSLPVKVRLNKIGQRLVKKRASYSAAILLILAVFLWLSYEPTPWQNRSVQQALVLPALENSTLVNEAPTTLTVIDKLPNITNKFDNTENTQSNLSQSTKYAEHLSIANQKAIELALAGQASQATRILEQALLNDPQAGVVFDNLRRLYAGFASQSYQLAIEPNKPKPVTVELASANQNIPVQLPANQSAKQSSLSPKTTEPLETSPSPSERQAPLQLSLVETHKERSIPVQEKPMSKPVVTPAPSKPTIEPTAAEKEAAQRKTQPQAIHQALKHWSDAWSKQDVKGYFASYTLNYAPKNSSRKAWMDYRQERILAPKRIKVELSEVKIVLLKPNLAKVSFIQSYTSDTLSARDQKTLELEMVNNAWLITSESGR